MQAKRMGPGYEIFYDNSGKGDVILRDTRSSNSVVVPQSKLIQIFGNKTTKSENNDKATKLMDLLQLNFINKESNIEVYNGSTASEDLVFEGTINNLKNETESMSAIAESIIDSIWNEKDITIILVD